MKTRMLLFMATGSPVGGVATWLDHACRGLRDRGYDPVVALVRGAACNDPSRFLEFHPDLNWVEVDGRGLNKEGRIRACQRLIRRLRPQIVLPLGVLDANYAAMREKSRRHDLYLVGRAQGNLPPMLADLQDLEAGIDHVVCVGEMTRVFLVQHAGFSSERVSHIPNGAASAVVEHVHTGPEAPLRLGYVGRLTDGDKRVTDIPELCVELDRRNIDYQMSVVGSGPCEEELQDRLTPFANRVQLLGARTAAQVYQQIYPNLDVLLLFSSSETFGIVLAEAMMNGVVPVTSRYLGFESQRLVVDGRHGLSFEVGNMSAAAEAVQQLATDRQLLAGLSRQARAHASQNYTWQCCVDQWHQVFSQILQVPPRKVPTELTVPFRDGTGRLDRLHIPVAVTDQLRRLRRTFVGPKLTIDGEEWPLFRRHHSPSRLDSIASICRSLEDSQRRFYETHAPASADH